MDALNAVLAHKLGLTPPEPDPDAQGPAPTPMRQMRRALGRAADKAVGLSASVLGIAEENLEAEALIESGPEDWVVIGLRDGSNPGLTGLFLINPALRSALVEMQTMGNLLAASEDERKVTRTDAVLAVPFASQLLRELADVGFGAGVLDPAAYDMGPMDDLRTAGLVMTPGLYRSWRISVQLGGSERQGEMLIAMRPDVTTPIAAHDTAPEWSMALRGAVEEAPADLEAVLARMVLPMSKIEEFEVGQVLQLAGTTVGSVSLVGPGGQKVAMARLGQVAGKRAVRVEVETIELQDDTPRAAPLPELEIPPVDGLIDSGAA
ncbi:FliM/FliN family flagellar motor switch protein [Octadecabacter sp. G9-8]|uniref:FliM/FliN family flagellar motor switch protein n=1 Tax=Octadecabacter dasysiphoniae TaxID=2909341 RepID=A0ABS9CSU7_9RHOB|nr:flagellar motor switch protein FliM [Octadecabacter dasysiphoniae]MCF2870297.1 FliM/FliN family flagellar motor switch protein [Octadecabacter dasysiphoniae]